MSKAFHFLRVLCVVALTASLAGCFGTLKPQPPVTITKYMVVKPGEEMTRDCIFPVPPDPLTYNSSTDQEKEIALYGFGLEGLDTVAKCNKQWSALRDWFTKQEKIYSDKK